MSMADIFGGRDPFEVWRFLLGTLCTVYAAVVTGRSLWRWFVYLSAPDRATSFMRQYIVVQLLRLRAQRFAWELGRITFWLAALAVVLDLHRKWVG